MHRGLRTAPLALLLVLGCYTATTTKPPAPTPEEPVSDPTAKVGKPAPPLEGVDADGKPVRLSDYRGKVVLVDFWMTH
jgi:cytochrome oxidase Cu insertion factor (SCO1/SenC/PrrC family)